MPVNEVRFDGCWAGNPPICGHGLSRVKPCLFVPNTGCTLPCLTDEPTSPPGIHQPPLATPALQGHATRLRPAGYVGGGRAQTTLERSTRTGYDEKKPATRRSCDLLAFMRHRPSASMLSASYTWPALSHGKVHDAVNKDSAGERRHDTWPMMPQMRKGSIIREAPSTNGHR